MTYAGVTYGDLYNGNMRFDVNISIAPEDSDKLGTRTEIKNLNSFRAVERVVEYEVKRQTKLLEKGQKVKQETRGWNDAVGETTAQRSKETAQDYRYMPDPDLPPIRLEAKTIDEQRKQMPKMPADYRTWLDGVLPNDIIEILLDYQGLMEKLSEVSAILLEQQNTLEKINATLKKLANLFSSVLLAEENTSLLNDALPSARQLIDLAEMNDRKELSSTAMKQVFLKFFDPEMRYKESLTIAKELGVMQDNDVESLAQIIDEVLAKPGTQKAQADYLAGQEKVLGFLVGQVMKASHGKANPATVGEILRQKLST